MTGWLENIPLIVKLAPRWRETVLRAIRAGLAVTVTFLLAAVTTAPGSLFSPETSPLIIIASTILLQAIDKALRGEPVA